MSDLRYVINQAQLRRDGVRLRRLAAAGQVVLIIAFLGIPLILYSIAHPVAPDVSFRVFATELLITGPFAPVNVFELIQGIAIFISLGRTRNLGRALSSDNPLGVDTLNQLKWLGYSLCALALVLCISIDALPGLPTSDDTVPTWLEAEYKAGVSVTPLYFGAMALTGLSIARRIVSEAVTLKTETQEFI